MIRPPEATIWIPDRSDVLNPAARTLSRYSPVGNDGNAYEPPSFACTWSETPVATAVAVISAFGTDAPDGSRTTPVIRPTFCCACSMSDAQKIHVDTVDKTRAFCLFAIYRFPLSV